MSLSALALNPEHFATANKTLYATLQSALETTLDGFEKVVALNITAVRSTLGDHVAQAKTLSSAKDLQEAFSLQGSLFKSFQPQVEKAIAYSRSLYDISAETQEELTKLVESSQSEFNKSFSSLLEQFSKAAPGGSDVAVAAVKSALSAANSAFENVNKAARQVADITEASVNAATSASVRAVNSTGSAAKKKAA